MTFPTTPTLRPFVSDDLSRCESILRALPKWFGLEHAIVEYVVDIPRMETVVAEIDGTIVGFLSLNRHNPYTAEVHLIAIEVAYHRRGIGRALLACVEHKLKDERIELLEVKTLGPSKPDASYDRTRQFYLAMGFRPLEETEL